MTLIVCAGNFLAWKGYQSYMRPSQILFHLSKYIDHCLAIRTYKWKDISVVSCWIRSAITDWAELNFYCVDDLFIVTSNVQCRRQSGGWRYEVMTYYHSLDYTILDIQVVLHLSSLHSHFKGLANQNPVHCHQPQGPQLQHSGTTGISRPFYYIFYVRIETWKIIQYPWCESIKRLLQQTKYKYFYYFAGNNHHLWNPAFRAISKFIGMRQFVHCAKPSRARVILRNQRRKINYN